MILINVYSLARFDLDLKTSNSFGRRLPIFVQGFKGMAKIQLSIREIDEIVQHMNQDHADSLLLYARHFGKCREASRAKLVGVTGETCTLYIEEPAGCKSVTIRLKRPVDTIKEAEIVMVEMHFEALRVESSKTREKG